MSFSYDRYDRRSSSNKSSRTTFGYWVPLVIATGLATAGVVAWVWRERSSGHHRDDDDRRERGDESSSEGQFDYGRGAIYSTGRDARDRLYGAGSSVSAGVTKVFDDQREYGYDEVRREEDLREGEESTVVGRVQGVLKRTPSPQQAYDSVRKGVTAGVAAASAAVGGALGSIREEGGAEYRDHERWSEEADARRSMSGALGGKQKSTTGSGGRKRSVVVVVSAEATGQDDEHDGYSAHASVLSHLPHVDVNTTNLFVLIYAPSLATPQRSGRPLSLASSISAIDTPAHTPGEELTSIIPQHYTPELSARDADASQELYEKLRDEAESLVQRQTMSMPFVTPTGCVHMLRHLRPDTVYIVEALSGIHGEVVKQIKGWVGQVVVVVGGDGGGLGGLVDTEDELSGKRNSGSRDSGSKWWQDSGMVGLGKGVEVVDGVRVGEDFERRVVGRE